jgi:hypothetical protein
VLVIVIWKGAAEAELQETVAVPEPPGIAGGDMGPQVRPAGTVSERDTTPPKPFSEDTVIVEETEEPTFAVAPEAETEKSTELKVTVVG